MMNSNCSETIFVGDSEMARLMRSHDWSQTSLGSPEQWPQSLKTTVRIVLTSRQPMFVWWGEQLLNLYNDAYGAFLHTKHPALAQPASQLWHEIWDQLELRIESARRTNEGTFDEAQQFIMERKGYSEETYVTFFYSPVPDDEGNIGGILCACTDDTHRIIGERQLALLRELAAQTADARTFDEACTLSASCLETNPYDLPFALIYLVDSGRQQAVLAGTSGIERGHPIAPETVAFDDDSVWSFAEVVESHQVCLIPDLATRFQGLPFQDLPTGIWDRSPHQAVAVPIAPSGQMGKAGILVVGLNPFRVFDDPYRGFIDLVAAQIAASIANAQAYEEERKRAEALAELDRAKTTFFSNISHEFRTPLTLMISPLEELSNTLDARLQPDEREQLQLVQRNSLRLQKLVNTLLDFSRIEAGRIQAVYEPTDLAGLTADLASVFRAAIEQAGLRLVIDCPPLPEQVYIDREMWEKIVLNLLSNAFKFTFEGEITVRLRASKAQVELEVQDTGTGIPAEELPRIFERFHRVKGARGRSYEGSGIGLSLVQELVRLHGGTIAVSSIVDQGTCFTVSIPTGCAHLPSEAMNATRTLTSTATGAIPYVEEALRWLPEESGRVDEWTSGRVHDPPSTHLPAHPFTHPSRILLVDDNADMRDYVKRLLSQYWDVEAVSDGLAALEAIAQRLPDLVLSDVMMPGLDGFALLRELRANPRTREIPMILLSARAGEESRIEGLAAGANDYLIKPFSARELLARIEANLKLAQLRREATQREQALRLEAETAQQQVETILSSISDAFVVLDREWKFTYVNDRYCEIVGMARQTLLGQNAWELFPEAANGEAHLQFQRALNQQTPVQFEWLFPAWNRWFEYRVYPSPDGLTIFLAEITDRKQVDAALRQSEERFQVALQNTPIVVFNQDRDLRYTWIHNPKFGYTVDDVLGKTDHDLNDPETAAALTELKQRVLASGIGRRQEVRAATPTGEAGYYDLTLEPMRDESGQVVGITAAVVDITELKHIEAALRESERRFRRLVESNIFGVAFGDFTGGIHYINDYFLDMLGYSREEIEGGQVKWTDITPPEFLPLDEQAMVELKTKGVATPFEKEYIRKDGTRVPILIGAALLQEPYEQQQEIVAFYLDLTDRKQAENALRRSEERLRVSQELSLDAFTILDSVRDETGAIVDFVWTYVNPKAAEILKHPVEKLVGQRLLEVLPGNQLNSELFQRYVQVVETGEPHDIELSYNADGIAGWFRNMAVKLEDGIAIFFSDITDRKQTEQALRVAEERLQVALQNAPITVFNQDRELKYTWIHNPVLSDLQEMLGQHDRDYLPPEDAEPLTAIKQRVLDTGIGAREEIKITRDGINYYYDLTVEPLRDSNHIIIGITCAAIDISELKRTEINLRESEERFRLFIIASSDMMYRMSADWSEMHHLTGKDFLASTESPSRTWLEQYIPQEDQPQVLAAIQEAIRTKSTFELEHRVIQLDGTIGWTFSRAIPLLDAQNEIIEWFGAASDVTERVQLEAERQQAETALRESEDRLRMAIESAQLGTWDWNLGTNELICDTTWKAIFGLSPAAQTSIELFYRALHPDDRERVFEIVQRAFSPKSSGYYDAEYRIVGIEDGIERWVAAKGQVYFNSNREPRRFIGTVLDITDRKQAEAAREQLLAREQAAREAAEAANRIKDEFLAVVSHELRSPLNPILGWAKLLRGRQLDAQKTDRALEVIERNAQMQAQLINDLLDVSRILRGKLNLDAKPVDLVSTIQGALETVRLAAEAKSIQIHTQFEPNVGSVGGDAGRLQQVIWNLLSNAVKFTSEGGRVDIRLERIDAEAQITVSDTGKGIPADFLPYVFEQFRQESSATTRRFGGLGLGLAIVRYLVESHGGTVQADSPGEGEGAIFTVKLPLLPHQPTANQDVEPSEPSPDLQGIRILVVDDDDNTREFLAFLLELHGANVIATASATEAITTLSQFKPNLLLSDIGMPDVDGYMLMRQVRALPPEQGGTIPAIALTAYAGEIDYQQAMAAGFQRHIAKPIGPQVLIGVISALCNSEGTAERGESRNG